MFAWLKFEAVNGNPYWARLDSIIGIEDGVSTQIVQVGQASAYVKESAEVVLDMMDKALRGPQREQEDGYLDALFGGPLG